MNVNRDIAGRFVGLLAGIGILASGWAQAPDPVSYTHLTLPTNKDM